MSSEIAQFYTDKSIFLTGATGFLGKVLIEKLLRSCPRIRKIYVLIRSKKSKTSRDRLNDLFACELYDKIKELNSNIIDKVVPVDGDIVEPNLGISLENEQLLIENVNIIIHSAATVRFDEPLKLAFEINVNGVKKMINLAKKLKNLEVFAHVSTSYANCDRSLIDEMIYPATIDLKNLSQTLEWMNDNIVDLITPNLIDKKPNTYTFTKSLAENLIQEYMNELPIVIVRPSIVVASWNEPFPGWIDNPNGPTGLLLASGKGVLRSMLGNRKLVADFIPVDTCVNVILASAWLRGSSANNESLIYNCSSGQINPLTWGVFEESCRDALNEYPFDNPLLVPTLPLLTTYKFIVYVRRLFEQLLIAHICDFAAKFTSTKRPFSLVRIQDKIDKATKILEFFANNEWQFSNKNMIQLQNNMNCVDREEFNIDIMNLDWPHFIKNYVKGTKRFILKEDLSQIQRTISKVQRKKYNQFMMKLFIAFLMFTYMFINDYSFHYFLFIFSLIFIIYKILYS